MHVEGFQLDAELVVAFAELTDGDEVEGPLGHYYEAGGCSGEAFQLVFGAFVEGDDCLDNAY